MPEQMIDRHPGGSHPRHGGHHGHGHGGGDHHAHHHAQGQHHGHHQGGAHPRTRRHPHGHAPHDDHGHSHAPATADLAPTGEERDPATNPPVPDAVQPWAPPAPPAPHGSGGLLSSVFGLETPEPRDAVSVPELLSVEATIPGEHPELKDPQFVSFRGSAVCPTPTATFLVVGQPNGPGPGRIWHVRSLRAVGGRPVANVADSAVFYFFVGSAPASPADGDVADAFRDWTAANTSPVQATYGRHEFVVRYPNLLYVLVTGGTAARVYTFTGGADDELEFLLPGSRETVSW